MGVNRGNQPVTIDLPELLHSSSSVTNDDHQYLKINIPFPTPEEQDCKSATRQSAGLSNNYYSLETQDHPIG